MASLAESGSAEGKTIASTDAGVRIHACTNCDALHYPAPRYCYRCQGQDFEVSDAGSTGTLYSFSRVHVAPKAFDPPYTVAYVDLPCGLRVFCRLLGAADEFRLGDQVELDGPPEAADDNLGVPKLYFRKTGSGIQ